MSLIIVDYGLGNLSSVKNMILKLGEKCEISSEPDKINKATKLILPGVGSFDSGIKNLNRLDLFEIINSRVLKERIPILGICLGAQLMLNNSDEGILNGFGWIDGSVRSFKSEFSKRNIKYPVPLMGWRSITKKKISKLRIIKNSRFYFVHSYFFDLVDNKIGIFETNYGINFISGFQKENIMGVQFHPEKSHKFGFYLIKSFIEDA